MNKPWQPSNPDLLAGWNALIEKSKQPRPDNPLRKGRPMKMWDYMVISSNRHNREEGRRIIERFYGQAVVPKD